MRRIYITIIVLAIFLSSAFIWWKNGTSPVNSDSNNPKIFIIDQGQGIRAISKNLKDEGLIKDQVVFFLLIKRLGLDSLIQAGSFRLFPSMSASEIAKELTH